MFKCVLILLLEIKYFVPVKNESLLFLDEGTFQGRGGGGGVEFSKILRSGRFRFFSFGCGGGGGEGG